MILRRIKFGAEFGRYFAALAVIAALVTAPAEVNAAEVARIGDTTYDSLVTAFSSAKAGETVELLCDVDLANAAWTPVNLLGNFDGKGHSIIGLNNTLFGLIGNFLEDDAKPHVSNLMITNATLNLTKTKEDDFYGILAKNTGSDVTISNIWIVSSSMTVNDERVGAIAGGGYADYRDCVVSNCTITGTEQVGGLVGYMSATRIERCKVLDTTVMANDRAGGLVGKLNRNSGEGSSATIKDNVVSGTVTANGGQAGGLFGQIMGNVSAYSITSNAIDVTFAGTPSATNPIGALRNGQNAVFTGALEENITGNTWTKTTHGADSFQYTNVASGVESQTIWNGEKPVAYVAQIGEKGYLTLEAAVDAAQSGDTITMLANSTEAQKSVVAVGKAITIDLKGFVLDGMIEYYGDLTLTNSVGTGYIRKTDDWALYGTGNLVLAADVGASGARSVSGVYASNGATVTIATDIKIYTYTDGIRCDGANLTVTGEPTVDSMMEEAALSINGNSTALIAGGTYSGDSSLSGDCEGPNVTVTGGKFMSYVNDSVCFVGSGKDLTVAISGGIYSDASAEEYLAAGYEVVANTDPTTKDDYPYAVVQSPQPVARVLEISGSTTNLVGEYTSLAAAFNSAKNGETVELLCDVDLANAAWTPVNMLGNFDGCGHTVSNLFIDLPDQAGVGFFSTTASGKWIRNVNFVNVDVTGLACVGGLVGTGCKGLVSDVTVSGVIRIKATGGDDNGYARAGVIVGGWAYGAYSNVVVNGTSPSVSYVKGADRTIDGRYVAGLIGHADDVTAYFGCTVSNLLIDATYCSAGLVGSGPCGAVCRDCRVENVEITGPYSGALFGWMNQEGASAASGSVVNATICNVTFDDVARCGTVGGWDSSTDVAVSNVTVVGGTVVPYHYQAYVEVGGDTVHYPTILTAIGSVEDIEDIVVGNDAVAVPDGYELYAKGALWGVREITKAVEIVETGVKYASIESALLDINGAATIRLLADCTTDRIELSDAKNSSVTSLTIDLNGHVLTDNGGDALLTKNRSIVIRDTAGAGVFEQTQTDDLVWIQGSQGGVTIESGVFRVGDAYGLAYASDGASAAQLVIRGGTFDKNPANDRKGRSYLPEGYASVDNGNGTWTVAATVNKDADNKVPVLEQKCESRVDTIVTETVIADVGVRAKIETSTDVTGVKLTVEGAAEQPSGIQAVVDKAKTNGLNCVAFKTALEAETASIVTVRVDVVVTPTAYVAPTAEGITGKIAFDLKPKATVTVVSSDESAVENTVDVSNDMIDQLQDIRVSVYTGFKPKKIEHKTDAGELIETFLEGDIVYDEATRVSEVVIHRFSQLIAYSKMPDGVAASVTTNGVTTLYASFTNAWADACAAQRSSVDATVKLLKDATVDAPLETGYNGALTLDVNDHVLAYTGANKDCIVQVGGGTLHVVDTATTRTPRYFTCEEAGFWALADEETDLVVKGGLLTGGRNCAIYYASNSGEVYSISNVNFVGNCSTYNGGAVSAFSTSIAFEMTDCAFFGNVAANNGGAVAVGICTMTDCHVEANVATNRGGGVYVRDHGSLVRTRVVGNRAGTSGGVHLTRDPGGCFPAGVKILMADGSEKKVEQIVRGDVVATFDHEGGTNSSAAVYYVYSGTCAQDVFTLSFASGATLDIADRHDLLLETTRKYVTVSCDNAQSFVGKRFYNYATGGWDELIGVESAKDGEAHYSIYTRGHGNCVANGLLTLPDDQDCFVNIYELDEALEADAVRLAADIETYGLATPEDYPNVPLDDFNDGNLRYARIAIGKGLTTQAEILFWNEFDYGPIVAKKVTSSRKMMKVAAKLTAAVPIAAPSAPYLKIGEDVVVTGNVSTNGAVSNFYVDRDTHAVIDILPDATGIDVGVTLSTGAGIFGWTNAVNYAASFFSDDPTYSVSYTEDGELALRAGIRVGGDAWATVGADGVCTIIGTGAMWNHDAWTAGNPLSAYRGAIRSVEINDGVTSVGSQFFHKFYLVTNVTCAASVATVGDYAFFRCNSLEKMSFGGDVTFGEQSYTLQAGIRIKDGMPDIYPIPSIAIAGYTQVLVGKRNLTDATWTDITTEAEKANYNFFKIELRK